MSGRSGEMARRAALGIGGGRNGGQVAQALNTLRFSVLDRRRGDLAAKRGRAISKRKDNGHLLAALSHEVKRLKGERQHLVERLERLPATDALQVSDHALIRFLERVMGMDLDAVRAQIARLLPIAEIEPDRVVYVRGGFQFMVFGRRLVTVLDGYMDPHIEEAFAIDDKGIDPPRPVDASRNAARDCARALSRRAHDYRAKKAETTARLRAELAAQSSGEERQRTEGTEVVTPPGMNNEAAHALFHERLRRGV